MVSSDLSKLRIDHIGSLVRPAKLKEAFARHDRKQAAHQELKKAQDDAIREVIRKQEEHGLPVVTDGEFQASQLSRKLFRVRHRLRRAEKHFALLRETQC